ncbi:MAG: hypothetical protein RIT27_368 [Pseudomonadota bacterium]|jgi:flagellar motor protein MotB
MQEENYLASLSDLMIGLLFIFIIILMGFALHYRQASWEQVQQNQRLTSETDAQRLEKQKLQAETNAQRLEKQRLEKVITRLTDNDSVRRDLLNDIEKILSAKGLRVLVDEQNGVLRLPEALLFNSGEADFRPEGVQAMQQVAAALLEILPCYSLSPPDFRAHCPKNSEARLEAVLIEGHTDNKPIKTNQFQDNWALATARALHTFQALNHYAPVLETLKNPQQQALLSVSAYEARRPVANQETEENRRQNRRIDLRFLMASPPPELMEKAKSSLQNK